MEGKTQIDIIYGKQSIWCSESNVINSGHTTNAKVDEIANSYLVHLTYFEYRKQTVKVGESSLDCFNVPSLVDVW